MFTGFISSRVSFEIRNRKLKTKLTLAGVFITKWTDKRPFKHAFPSYFPPYLDMYISSI